MVAGFSYCRRLWLTFGTRTTLDVRTCCLDILIRPSARGGALMWCVKRRWVVSWLVGGRRVRRCGSWRAGSGCGGGPGRGRPGPRRFALVSFALVVGLADGGGAQRGESGQEHGALEPLVAAAGDVLTTD